MSKKEHKFGCLILVIDQKLSDHIEYIFIRHICEYWGHSFVQARLLADERYEIVTSALSYLAKVIHNITQYTKLSSAVFAYSIFKCPLR